MCKMFITREGCARSANRKGKEIPLLSIDLFLEVEYLIDMDLASENRGEARSARRSRPGARGPGSSSLKGESLARGLWQAHEEVRARSEAEPLEIGRHAAILLSNRESLDG
jgi:hypothetical protein